MVARKSASQRVNGFERAFRVVAFVASVGVAVVMALNFPPVAPTKTNPSYLDNIFASRITLFAARLLLVEGALFLVSSIVIRTLGGDWATKAGGIDTVTSSDLDAAVDDLGSWKGRAQSAEEKVDALEDRLRATEGNLRAVLADLEKAEAKLAAQAGKRGSAGEGL